MSNADRLIELFSEAKAKPAGVERERFLAESCRDDPEMKAQVLSLLEVQERAGDFLKFPVGQQEIPGAERPGDAIGAYKLRETLGEGGCGVVYVAEQEKPVRRLVALKVIKLGMDTRAVVARFEAERQALAVMDHPNIARVLEAGATESGRPYFVMELVRGVRITEYSEQNGLSIEERIRLFIQVCHAIQHAHQKGIIHRDIKPSNILVTLHDGVPVPKVIDFGIAKATEGRLTNATVYTQLHQFIGTPAYMSPEQAEMSGLDIDTRADIYSLGVVLYELLAGCTPFDSKELTSSSFEAMRKAIREKEPMRPSTRMQRMRNVGRVAGRESPSLNRQSQIDPDLDWIVMKCLEKDRQRRYETANGLAADLKRYLDNELVVARPPSNLYRLQKTFRRHKMAFATASVVALSLALALIASVWQVVKVERAQGEVKRKSYVSAMNLARQAWDDHDLTRLRRLLEQTAEYSDRGFEWYYWQRQVHLELKTLRGHLGPVVDVAFSPNGERVLTASLDGTARVWDATDGTQRLRLKGHRRGVTSAAWSPDGLRIATASEDKTAAVSDAATGTLLFKLRGHSLGLTSVRFSPDGQHIVTGSLDRSARLWRADTGQEVRPMIHGAAVCSVGFSPDGQRIVTAGKDEIAIVWDAATGVKQFRIQAPPAQIPVRPPAPPTFYAAFSPDGDSIVTVSQNHTATLWDAQNGARLFPIKGNSHFLSPRQTELPLTAGYSPDGKKLILGGLDFTATVWRLGEPTNLFTLKGHESEVVSAAFSPDGQRVITGSYDHTAKIWSGVATTETLKLDRQTKVIAGAAFSSSDRVVTACWDGTAMVWNLATGKVQTLPHGTNLVWCAAFSADGTKIVTGTQDGEILSERGGSIHVWASSAGRELMQKIRAHDREIHNIEFSKDGRRILTAAADATARLWDAFSGEELKRFKHNYPWVFSAFSSDSRRIVTLCGTLAASWTSNPATLEPAEATVWDAETGQKLLSLEPRGNAFSGVAYSPDGKFIVAGGVDRIVTVWDASTGKIRRTLEGHHAQVITVAVSPDSRRIITGGFDNTTKFWDAAHDEELLTLKGGILAPPGISRDGRRIVTGPEPPATLWEAASSEAVERWHEEKKAGDARIAAERRERDAAEAQERASGIKQWLVLAPVRLDGVNGAAALDQELLAGEANLRPREGDRVRVGQDELVWLAVRQSDFRLDFQQLTRRGDRDNKGCVAYAVCYIASETTQSHLNILVGSDDHAKIYLNGQQIYRHSESRACEPDQDEASGLTLHSGINVFVFKVINEAGDWAGSVRFTDAAGQPVKRIRVILDPG